MKALVPLLSSFLLFSCSKMETKSSQYELPDTIQEAVNSKFRSLENMKRDKYRHPVETLEFFGLKKNMTVVEISPGAGWYTEILAPLLAEEGHYIASAPAVGPKSPDYAKVNDKKMKEILSRHPEVQKKSLLAPFSPMTNKDIVKPGTADMVLTFRNVHNWMENNAAQSAFSSFYRALRPGGVLGVVEHRRPHETKIDGKSGYMSEKQVIALAKKAGFKLVGKSEINSNPNDKGNHPKGVWTLPPNLRMGEIDRAKYEAIGESDRMTLKFVK